MAKAIVTDASSKKLRLRDIFSATRHSAALGPAQPDFGGRFDIYLSTKRCEGATRKQKALWIAGWS
jgi:hypothetical protein